MELPVSVKVRLVKVTLLLPGLVISICWTVTAEPGSAMEFPGGFAPCEAITVTGVEVHVTVGEKVAVKVGVHVGLEVDVRVAVEVVVFVAVLTKVFVGVEVVV